MCPVHSKWGYTSSTHRTPWLLHTFISFLSWFSYMLRFYMDYRSQSTWLLFLLKWSIILSRHFNNVEKTDIVTDRAMISTALCSFVQIQIFLPLNRFLSHFLQCCSIGDEAFQPLTVWKRLFSASRLRMFSFSFARQFALPHPSLKMLSTILTWVVPDDEPAVTLCLYTCT